MKSFLFGVALCAFVAIAQAKRDGDSNVSEYVQSCLAEQKLDISALGISKLEDLDEHAFDNLSKLEEGKRGCFVACVFKKQGRITADGKLAANLGPSHKHISPDKCKDEKDLCKLGNCLHTVYF